MSATIIPYTGSPLDRMSAQRDDEAWIAVQRADPCALFVPVWQGKSLFRDDRCLLLRDADTLAWRNGPYDWALLGIWDGRPVFGLGLSGEEPPPAPPGARFMDMRRLPALLPAPEAAILAHARGLMHWHARQRFCGVCGGACVPKEAGHKMLCTGCGAGHFPRTDPAVIMLVTHRDRALLAHAHRFADTVTYSALAGFVEPGESLEEAVARETHEEAGLRLGRIEYRSSQPWPFPASIMLGFRAEAIDDAVTVEASELRDARWFTRAEVADPAAHGFALPRADSIAHRLIAEWLAEPAR